MIKGLLPAALAATILLPSAVVAQGTQTGNGSSAIIVPGLRNYSGNGATGFGGPLGNGTLTVSSTATSATDGTITFSLAPGATLNDDAVIYIDSAAGGFADTSSFMDNGDGGRTAVSGYNGNNTPASRTLATFAPGFTADYALSIENGYVSLFGLASGGSNSLHYITGASQSGAPYTLTFTDSQLSILPGQTFDFVGTLISTSAYRSNETIGDSTTVPDSSGSSPNAGYNGTTTFSNFETYTTLAPAPEPSGVASLLIGAVALVSVIVLRRRQTA